MRTLDKYIFREMLTPLIIGTASAVLMFLANMLIAYAGSVFQKEIGLVALGQYLYFKIPQTLNLTLPVGVTIASALAISRLARDSELTAIRAGGISLRRAIAPILVVGLFVSVLSFVLAEKVTPASEAKALKTLRNIFASGEGIGLQSNVLLKLNNGEYLASIGTVRKGPEGEIQMSEVVVFHRPRSGEDWIEQAPTATYKDGILVLHDVSGVQMGGTDATLYRAERHPINIRLAIDDYFGLPQPEALTAEQLKKTIAQWRRQGQDTRTFEVDYHNKFAVPAACFVFALFSPVFALYFARGGAFIGVLVSIIIVFLYYNVWVLSSQVFSKLWVMPPVLGAWLPNILFFVVGAIALWRLE